jgi:hypothetical protein
VAFPEFTWRGTLRVLLDRIEPKHGGWHMGTLVGTKIAR